MRSSVATVGITTLSGRFHAVCGGFSKTLKIDEGGRVHAVFFHPDRETWSLEGRYEPSQAVIRYEDGSTVAVDRVAPHILEVDGQPHRRILDDGTIVDYPRTTRGTFASDPVRVHLRIDGGLLWERTGDHGGLAVRGHYDLYRGFVRFGAWSGARPIALLPGGDLRLGETRFRRVA